MSLSRRTLPVESRVVIIDDFMKAGGTAKGMVELLLEFKSKVLGIGVLIDTKTPEKKLVEEYYSLLKLEIVNEEKKEILIKPYLEK
jgi:purine operon repressor